MTQRRSEADGPDALQGVDHRRLGRRQFCRLATSRAVGIGALSLSLPGLLAACGGGDDDPTVAGRKITSSPPADDDIRAIVGDVLDFELTSNDWPGAFGWVTFRLHKGIRDGKDVYFIRTDTSDEAYAAENGLVFAPRLSGLIAADLPGGAYEFANGAPEQATVFSYEPGDKAYSPAWRVNRVTWEAQPRTLASVADIEAATKKGDVSVERTEILLNAAIVKWSTGDMPVDTGRAEYLGGGQLLEAPDTKAMSVMFKLHECFPGTRYIVCDTSLEPMAAGMNIAHSPGLTRSPRADATGRTNVFMNGIKGSGPMGFQPSVFDSQAGDMEWSPYWDHMTYAWKKGVKARVLTTEDEIHAARDAGELDEFPGTPDTNGAIFTVNCPVPVVAPNTFKA